MCTKRRGSRDLWSVFAWYYMLLVITISLLSSQASTAVNKEYCYYETFNATCTGSGVILIQQARYGRMALGRCVKSDMGHLGCAADVTSVLDRTCSGLQQCQVPVDDERLRKTAPCAEELTWYLLASYSCVNAISVSQMRCHRHQTGANTRVISPPTGYLLSPGNLQDINSEHFRKSCPWVITAGHGQTISVKLHNLSPSASTVQNYCVEYGQITDGSHTSPVMACSDLDHREKHIYSSKSSQIQIHSLRKQHRFMLKYTVEGCADKELSSLGLYSRRDGDRLLVHCNRTDDTWNLVCKDTKWIGSVGDCSPVTAVTEPQDSNWRVDGILNDESFPYGLVIAVASGVALGVFLGGLSLAAFSAYMKRRQREDTARRLKAVEARTAAAMMPADTQIYTPRKEVPGEWIRLATSDYGSSQQTDSSCTPSTLGESGVLVTHAPHPSATLSPSVYHAYERPSAS